MSNLINSEMLFVWCGCKQKSRLELWLRNHGIKYWISADGYPITTLEAVNDSFKDNSTDKFDF